MDDLQQQLDRAQRRARRYWFEDGLAEVFSSLVFLIVGLYFLVQHAFEGRVPGVLLNLVFPVLIVVLAFAGRRMVRIAKDRLVHPRTGYVAFQRARGNRWATGALAFVISIMTTLLLSRAPMLVNWIPAVEGLVFGLAFLWLGRMSGLVRFPVEGIATALIGLGVSLLRLDDSLAAALLFCAVSGVMAVGGLTGLVGYLRHAPPRGEA